MTAALAGYLAITQLAQHLDLTLPTSIADGQHVTLGIRSVRPDGLMTNTNVGPLRLAVGNHRAGSGKGCAMNVISWENGDSRISDMPDCTHPLLARVVQRLNDSICEHRDGDLLCADCSVIVLGLAHRTVGTADADPDGRVMVRIAAEEAQRVAHLNSDPRVQAAIDAALAWADTPTNAAAAAAYAAAGRVEQTERIIDRFRALTGHDTTAPDPTVTAQAITRMLQVTA